MKLSINQNVDKIKWRKLLDTSPFASPFQSLENFELFNAAEGFSADVFAVKDESDYKSLAVVAIQKEKGLKGYFSIRGIIYGGPLMVSDGAIFLEYLLNEIRSYYNRKLIYLEIRNHFDYNSYIPVFQKAGWKFEPHLNIQLNTENKDYDGILKEMKYNRRREINQSLKHGALSRKAKNEEEVRDLYVILKDLYDNRVKVPLSPLTYFLHLFNSKIGQIFVVEHNNKIIGGAFCVYYENLSINTLYYAGLRNYHKKIFPTHLAVLEVIDFAINNELKMVDFMGAGKPGVEYGVRNYKLQFGGKLVEHGRFLQIFNPFLYNFGKMGLEIIKKIK